VNESLTLVLKGNNPRFPWKPSTTMLTYRLSGTTEAPASDRSEHTPSIARGEDRANLPNATGRLPTEDAPSLT
jgi:hypothetical protein